MFEISKRHIYHFQLSFVVNMHIRGLTKCFFKKVFVFINGLFSASFSLFLSFQYSWQETNIQYKFCRWLDLTRGPLVSEATAVPTEPQPLPKKVFVTKQIILLLFEIMCCESIFEYLYLSICNCSFSSYNISMHIQIACLRVYLGEW